MRLKDWLVSWFKRRPVVLPVKPYGGQQETARRARQIASGRLTRSNGLED